jgi:mannosyltransferase OCH1-like enzyme
MDMEVLKDFSELFNSGGDLFLINCTSIGPCVTNLFMASRPRHPIWLAYLEYMKRPPPWYAISKHFEVMLTTGPLALVNVLQNSKVVYSVLPSKFMNPCSMCNQQCAEVGTGYLRSLGGGSWNSWDSLLLNFIFCNWKYVVLFLLLCAITWFVWKRKRTNELRKH